MHVHTCERVCERVYPAPGMHLEDPLGHGQADTQKEGCWDGYKCAFFTFLQILSFSPLEWVAPL